MQRMTQRIRNRAPILTALLAASPLFAADHLDTASVIADPRADIGDLYAWTSYDGRQLNLAMTIVGHTFSDRLEYVFHIDSGKRFGETTATTDIVCRIANASNVLCKVGDAAVARVFAGLRDDPFYNNVKGTREAYAVAADAMMGSAKSDAAGCPMFSDATSRLILETWRHTGGGPAKNFLAGWTPASLVVSVDLNAVNRGGTMLGVWATTGQGNKQIDRMGRPLTGNALLGSFADEAASDRLKERYNSATPATGAEFIPEMERTLGIYDGFDGTCGNQLLADPKAASPARYRALATVLADDRLWINSESSICGEFFSVEFAALGGDDSKVIYCGGRTPNDDAIDVYRSVLSMGQATGIDDGVDRDDREHSISDFPFLAAP
ncbi:hypothetical protein GCM10011487_41890 [Steroidobacter agaridevorans]|uniref:DUF4331 domain-containing protein n=2 Tax=Steroidobacter agaridevorans TaxID=2695856 RepID=A0A829YFZ0_9GAMM|nr:hypothetical protein GCM10011487_41890 [Steroidobacter agaridevorans]